jgi:hypothetical protein
MIQIKCLSCKVRNYPKHKSKSRRLFTVQNRPPNSTAVGSATWHTTHVSSTNLKLYFLIQYCYDNTRKVRAPNAGRRSGVLHVY